MPEPIYVSNRKWAFLVLGIVILFSGLLFTNLLFGPRSGFAPAQLEVVNAGLVFFFAIGAFPYILGAYFIVTFFRSRRIEFYEDSFKVNGEEPDIPYSVVKVGEIGARGPRGSTGFPHFSLSIVGANKSWDVSNGNVHGKDSDIYSWVRERSR